MAEIELVIKIDEETFQDILDSRYISPHIKECFRNAKPLSKGHTMPYVPISKIQNTQTIIEADD